MTKQNFIKLIFFTFAYFICITVATSHFQTKQKSVLAILLTRNKEHTLPYFLSLFSKLNYPKERISLYIRSDHNNDRTSYVIRDWLEANGKYYNSIDIFINDGPPFVYPDEVSPTNWTSTRFDHIISLKDEALHRARKMWADYVWFIDVDVFLLNPDVLKDLIAEEKPIVAPMLKALETYSNYWCGMTQNYWYERTEEYLPILNREKTGCFSVIMVHSCVLIDLSLTISDHLSFESRKIPNYDGPRDDIITFAVGVKKLGLNMYVCNKKIYGYILNPLNEYDKLSKDYQYLTAIKLEALVEFPPISVSPEIAKYELTKPQKSHLGFNNIYLINLIRRPDRREKMLNSFDELGIKVEIFDAIDGKRINETYLADINVKQLPKYKDPWNKRDMTYGEIGCFMSHYYIWQDIVRNGYEKVIIFEDDIRFQPFFIEKLDYLMQHMEDLQLSWDLVYLGRKKLQNSDEPWVDNSDFLVHVDYSYWTLCYMITLEGARKLLHPKPLGKMVPVDEYIPIMFDKHPMDDWKESFWPRNLLAFSTAPLMVFPTHYTGEEGYISDTEESSIIPDALLRQEDTQEGLDGPIGPPSIKYKGFDIDVDLGDLKRIEL